MRRLRILVENLPPTGARWRKIRGHAWTDDTYLAAVIADRVGEVGAGMIRALGGKARPPKALPRPDDSSKRLGSRGDVSTEDVLSYLSSLKPA